MNDSLRIGLIQVAVESTTKIVQKLTKEYAGSPLLSYHNGPLKECLLIALSEHRIADIQMECLGDTNEFRLLIKSDFSSTSEPRFKTLGFCILRNSGVVESAWVHGTSL